MNVLIFGLGLNQGGVGSAKFFAKQGAKIRVTDLKSAAGLQSSLDALKDFPEIEYVLGEHKNSDIDWADLIIKNPAVKPGNPYIEYALKQGKRVEQDMGIFLDFVKPEQIVGITGTKGKSTTSSLIYEMLKSVEKKAILLGNIGTSVLDSTSDVDLLEDTTIVLEVSSFQLEAFEQHKVSPKYAVITNIYPDHLNYYQSMEEYIAAKKVIGKYQTNSDYLFLRKDDLVTNSAEFLKNLKGQIVYFSQDNLPAIFKPTLAGEHNLENMAAAYQLGKIFNIPEDKILQSMSNFKGVPFRMELVKDWNGVKIINDTTATGPNAGIQALKTFPGSILICGGMNKNMPYEDYIKAINQYAKQVFFLEGDATDLIRTSTPSLEVQTFGPYSDLEKLLTDVKEIVKPGDIILFSPAATSFNLFQNEFDRGRKFNTAVEKIFQ